MIEGLHRLARLYGVQPTYVDAAGVRRISPPETILALLRGLGASVARVADLPDALRETRGRMWSEVVPPVVVAWDGGPLTADLRVPAGTDRVRWELTLENGEARSGASVLDVRGHADVDGTAFVRGRVVVPGALPPGYHRLAVEVSRRTIGAVVVSAPLHAYPPEERAWGVFLPLYSLRTARGGATFTGLRELAEWVGGLGGRLIGTLPLLAAFLDAPFDPSPYAPASRLFWNEFYVDPSAAPEFRRCPEARDALAAPTTEFVDYRREAAARRRAIGALARCFSAERGERTEAFDRFLATRPRLLDYARFRAAGERFGAGWPRWPEPARSGTLRPSDYDDAAAHAHLYAQWLAEEQLAEAARASPVRLYLDLPLGVHPDGYDVWRERDLFATEVTAGAPPDAFFIQGQNWGFPPLHPAGARRRGYGYLIDVLRHHLAHAGVLRVDHVMGLHRLFWIPRGAASRDGAYVRYHADELYAIITLESHRHQAAIAGEDLGTVPPVVRAAMQRHGVQRSYVLPFEVGSGGPNPPPRASVAALDTHDTPAFAAYWDGDDIRDRVATRLLTEDGAGREAAGRAWYRETLLAFLRRERLLGDDLSPEAVLRACLAFLGRSDARAVVVNLEDLWLERRPQNVPGTAGERPNWRRRAARTLESVRDDEAIASVLRALDAARRGA